MPRSRLLLPLALALGALGVPATASADFQAHIQPDHVSIVGTDADEAVLIRSSGPFLTHSLTTPGFASSMDFDSSLSGVQLVQSTLDDPVLLVVDAEGGDDSISLDTPLARLSADGGEGDDSLMGSGAADRLLGGSGADVALGRGGRDSAFLGEGDDRYSYQGILDGQDAVNGGGGTDRVAIVGSQDDDHFKADAGSTVIRLAYAGHSSMRLSNMERIAIHVMSGDDSVLGQEIPVGVTLEADGGPGVDELHGGHGDDLLSGEMIAAGDGDDRMVLRAGGGAFNAGGGEGADVTHVTGASADDAITLRPEAPSVRIDGSLTGKATGEAVVVDAGRGDDNLSVMPGTGALSAVVLNGGLGNDVLRGSEGVETLDGDAGLDVLDGGRGPDRLLGGADDDVIRARDGVADAIDCAGGEDVAFVDLGGLDAQTGCEQIQPGAVAAAVPLARVFGATELTMATSEVEVPVACSAGARGGCHGFVDLVTAEPLAVGVAEAPPAPVALGSAAVDLAPGASGEVVVAVPLDNSLLRVQAELGRPLQIHAQVRTELAEHATALPLEVLR